MERRVIPFDKTWIWECKKAIGIYADSVEAAATLAVVTGAFIDDTSMGLVGMGGSGGYYHFHDFNHIIHIWYGSKVAWEHLRNILSI